MRHVHEAMAPPLRSERVPPVDGNASESTRVGSCDLQRPFKRSTSVWGSETCQSMRISAVVLSVVRSPSRSGMLIGTPVVPASARKRAASSGLTPSRSRVAESAVTSDGRASARQRPCTAPNAKRRLRTSGPPNPPLRWLSVYPSPNGDDVAPPHARARSRRL